jgi:polyhydroxybutyrate depolymerase
MTMRTWAALLGMLGAVVGNGGCRRADLYAITAEAAGGGNSEGGATGGSAGGGSAGDGHTGGSNASGGSVGNAGNAGNQSTQPVLCPSPALGAGDRDVTLQVGADSRNYVLHVPSTYDGTKPVPLVLDFHGVGGTGRSELSSSPYPAVTDPEGVVMAFPDGMPGPAGTAWNMGPCCVAGYDDVAFARALVADVQKTVCVDPVSVYAVGVLTGGGMAYYLACRAADLFAAVAPAAFDLLQENVDECTPSRPITEISFRGTAPSRVPYDGGPSKLVPGMGITFLGAKETFARWAKIDGCTGSPSQEDSHGCSSYSGCQAGVEVILCTKKDGAEDPGDPNIAWPVLKRHTL